MGADDEGPQRSAGALDNEMAREALGNLATAMQVGTLSGIGGLLAGAVGGILRSTAVPTLFAVASGIQWFTLGATFTAARQFVIKSKGTGSPDSVSPIIASTIAGAAAGGVGGAIRSRRNILPGMVFFGVAGAVGQKVYDYRQGGEVSDGKIKSDSWINSKWSPVKVLSDDEYEKLLQEKMLRVSADLAILDESIEAVKKEATMEVKKESQLPAVAGGEEKKA